MNGAVRVGESDLPALHGVASSASLKAQRTYLRLVRWDLILMVMGALVTAVSFTQEDVVRWIAAVGLLMLVGSLVLTLVISLKNYEQQWYGGRAAAESVKTSAWRYMAAADPYAPDLAENVANQRFLNQLRSVIEQSEQLRVRLGAVSSSSEQITSVMKTVRALPLADRKVVYIKDRIQEQQDWYSDRSRANEAGERDSFVAITAAQLFAIAAALLLVLVPTFRVNLAAVASAVAAALFAWLQVKRHQELAQSYEVAANELSMIAEEAKAAATDDQFGTFVADAESAISREHTLWVARRDVPGTKKRLQ